MAPQTPTKLTSASKLSAWVTVDDVPVPVYQVEERGNKVTCFIEAVEGKEFKVGFENVGFDWSELCVDGVLDGTTMDGVFLHSTHNRAILEGRYVSAAVMRPFVFAKLVLTDDPDLASTDENFVKNLGTIQVHMHRVYYLGSKPFTNRASDGVKNQVAHERSKKATLSHQANLGQAKVAPVTGEARLQYVDQHKRPSQIFEFKYRSRALLELQGLVEPAPAPPQPVAGPSTSKGNKRKASTSLQVDKDGAIVISSDDDSDEDDAAAELARLDAEIEKLKKRKEKLGSKKVKEEPGSTEVKKERLEA
ncbi:hypothetical protein JCM5296_004200 [Sporobolomyces johnsonii]